MQEIIDWVNLVRQYRGLGEPITELSKGTRGVPRDCALAASIGGDARVMPMNTHYRDYRGVVGTVRFPRFTRSGFCMLNVETMPPYVNEFALAFDNGKYPELIA